MELERIRPGKPMDDITWIKYLRQGNVAGKFQIKGKVIIPYDLKFILINHGPKKGGVRYNILFGNYFNETSKASSIAIVGGAPFKTESMLCFINPPYDTVKKDAVALEVINDKTHYKVRLNSIDRRKLSLDFLEQAKNTGQKINPPIKLHGSVHVECSFVPVSGKPYFFLQIENEERFEAGENADTGKGYKSRYIHNFEVKRQTPWTDIISRIKAINPKREEIKLDVTPEMAEDLLTLNTENRHLRNEDVYRYAEMMEKGEWEETNESTLGVSKKNVLIDGQHRLLAQIKAGATIRYTIYLGLAPDAFKYINSGRKRDAGDTMSVRKLGDPNQAAATVYYMLSIQKYNMCGGTRNVINNQEIDKWISDEGNLRRLEDAIKTCRQLFREYEVRMITKTIWTGLYLLFREKNKNDADTFMELLVSGASQSKTENSPIFYLNKRLVGWVGNEKAPKGGKGTEIKTRWIITGWNYFRQKDARGRPLIIESLKIDEKLKELPKIAK